MYFSTGICSKFNVTESCNASRTIYVLRSVFYLQSSHKKETTMDMRTAQAVLGSYWDGLLPVKPDAIAQRLGIEVHPLRQNSEMSGLAEIRPDGRKIIAYNPNERQYRTRFTIAHELAHHLLGHTAQYDRCFRDYSDASHQYENRWIETEANRFAAELLMPGEALKVLIERRGITEIRELAHIFDVSESAMYWRLNNLGYPV